MNSLEKLKNKMAEQASITPVTYNIAPVVSCEVNVFNINFDIDSEQVVKRVREFRAKHETSNISNVNAWHSPYYLHHYTKDFDNLIKIVEDKVWHSLKPNYLRVVECIESWAIIYKKGDKTDRHKHADQLYSAVYYAKAEPNAAPIKFDNYLTITPVTGMLVCFPGWLMHEVPEITDDQERICVAFNLNCVSTIDKKKLEII